MSPQTYRGETIVSKRSYTSYYADRKRDPHQRPLKSPKKRYYLSFGPDGNYAYECTKTEFDRFDVPDLTAPEDQSYVDRWAADRRFEARVAIDQAI